MKKRSLGWVLGAILAGSLIVVPADAAKQKKIPAAKRYHVTQITDRDVVVLKQAQGARVSNLSRYLFENERRVLVPKPDVERQKLVPNPDVERQKLVPNPDVERQKLVPNPDVERQKLVPNPDVERQVRVPNPDVGE